MDFCVFCCLLLLLLANFRWRSFFTPVNDLRLWDKIAGGVSVHHLSSTWRACYKLFFIGWKSGRCSFKLSTGYPVLLLSNRKNTFFSDMLMRMWTHMFWVSKSSTSLRKFWSMRVLKYVKLRQHNFAEILLKKRVCEDKSRSVYPDDDASGLETCGSSKFCLFHWVLMKNFFHLYPE